MAARRLLAKILAWTIAFALAACSATSSATLAPGMTPDQAVQSMGTPDLKDSIPDPNHSGATVLRYVWLDSGKVAIFGPNDRVASIQQIEPAEKTQAEAEASVQQHPDRAFDPIDTPLNYAFFPIRAAFIYIGAGLNCAVGSGCHKPKLPDPSQG